MSKPSKVIQDNVTDKKDAIDNSIESLVSSIETMRRILYCAQENLKNSPASFEYLQPEVNADNAKDRYQDLLSGTRIVSGNVNYNMTSLEQGLNNMLIKVKQLKKIVEE